MNAYEEQMYRGLYKVLESIVKGEYVGKDGVRPPKELVKDAE